MFKKNKGNKGNNASPKKKGLWANVGAIWENERYDGTFFTSNGYDGTLLFLARDKEGGEPKLYRIAKAKVRDRDALINSGIKVPKSLVCNLSVNLENESNEEIDLNSVEKLSDLLEEQDSED